jgi:hypothetical protein
MAEIELTAQAVEQQADIGAYDYVRAWAEARKYPKGARFFKTGDGIRVVPKDNQEVMW